MCRELCLHASWDVSLCGVNSIWNFVVLLLDTIEKKLSDDVSPCNVAMESSFWSIGMHPWKASKAWKCGHGTPECIGMNLGMKKERR